jgi:DNA repair protein RadB
MLEPFLSEGEVTKISLKTSLDTILNGGLESKTVTQFYGPPASGKTNLCHEPFSFSDQQFIVENLDYMMKEEIGLIILDSAVAFYRFERNDENASELNKALAAQIAKLSSLARKQNLAVVITTQVYASYEVENGVEPVGGSMLKYWSKVIIELKKDGKNVEAKLVRHRELAEGLQTRFQITEKGIETVEK